MAGIQTISSSALSTSPNFSQGGQVDWIALSQLAITCPLDIASRLSKAGIDQVTVLVASTVCSSFHFPPEGQKQLTDSLSSLKGHSSYSKLAYFGFGIKHIVNDLLVTEQGSLCVALSAALAVPYTTFQAARIWRELCILKDIPGSPIPAIHQWKTIIDVCAGALRRSKLHSHYEIFSRFLDPQVPGFREPARAKDVAKALLTLGQISKGSHVSYVFTGGIECAWLAAVAETLFGLNIEVQDHLGKCFHRSVHLSEHGSTSPSPVQAYFRRMSPERNPSSSALEQHVCFITKGEELLKETLNPSMQMVQRPTSWEKVFSDTFEDWARFVDSPARKYFTDFLACTAIHSTQYFSSHTRFCPEDFSEWWLYMRPDECLYHPNGSGDRIVQFCQRYLPEIPLPDDLHSFNDLETTRLLEKIKASIYGLKNECQCESCSPAARKISNYGSTCLTRLALTIIRFLLILSPVSVHSQVPPSMSALRQLYNHTTVLGDSQTSLLGLERLGLVFFLFSGQLQSLNPAENVSAISAGGICVFLHILKDLNISVLEAMEIQVVPGHVSYQDQYYTLIKDTTKLENFGDRFKVRSLLETSKFDFQLVAEEQEDRDALGVLYKLTTEWNSDVFIHPKGLQTCLTRFLRTDSLSGSTAAAVSEIQAGVYRWSFTEHDSARPAIAKPVTSSNCWSILTWSASDISSDNKSQWLNIRLLTTDNVGLFLAAQDELCVHDVMSSDSSRSCVHIARFEYSSRSIVQVALLSWAAMGSNEQQASHIVEMNALKKQGTIQLMTTDKSNWKEQDVLFELNLISKTKRSHLSRKSWKFLKS